MYWAGFTQSAMWKEFTPEGILKYPNFLETVNAIMPMYITRSLGGALYLVGSFFGIYNLVKTMQQGSFLAEEPAEAPALAKNEPDHAGAHWHRWIERRPIQLLVVAFVMVVIGGVVEMIPTFLVKSNIPTISSVKPYTPLELQGRDLYIREGCYVCHSQMIRPFRSEVARYGEYSKAGEFVYDHPFQWGSKRTGPDLAREGGKYPDSWHYNHMDDPRTMSPGSIMPPYPHMLDKDLDVSTTDKKIRAMQTLGVPYPDGYDKIANADLEKQAKQITESLKKDGITCSEKKEIIAMIAYLQRLGTDIKGEPTASLNAEK
jgi:cytochrome c oxidase cbb3-type subunit I/II